MLTAHLPSGFLVGNLATANRGSKQIMAASLIGAMIPDLDMLYFHFVDFGRTHHHQFISHWPLAWLALGLSVIFATHVTGCSTQRTIAIAFFSAVILHFCLDSIAAPVFWLMPFSKGQIELVQIPANYGHWIISYLLHWTFALELSIWLAALIVYKRRNNASTAP